MQAPKVKNIFRDDMESMVYFTREMVSASCFILSFASNMAGLLIISSQFKLSVKTIEEVFIYSLINIGFPFTEEF